MKKGIATLKRALGGLATAAVFGLLPAADAAAATVPLHDNFYWIGQINKASMVINSSEGLLTKDEAAKFARGLEKVLAGAEEKGAKRPASVIAFEPLLIEAAGIEVTKVHVGRSSQDMLAACRESRLRERMLNLADALNSMSATLIKLAEEQRNTVVPNYTNGVAAQPNSYGHYLLAYADCFARDSQRLHQYYARLNQSPVGTTVLNGTSWPLNRKRMADYLGYDDIRYNAYDAVQGYAFERAVEAGSVVTTVALHVGSFIEELSQQYAQPRPWIILQEGGANTYVSSAMPQKRNPGILMNTRSLASTILGNATGTVFRAHNLPPGMRDVSDEETYQMVERAEKMVRSFEKILKALRINPDRSKEELNLDWTASQEVADVLMREHGIPFRLGHHFASEMVGYARANGLTPLTFPYAEAKRIYSEAVTGYPNAPKELPLSEQAFRSTLDPVAIVKARATKGGPQDSEMNIMFDRAKKQLAADEKWQAAQAAKFASSESKLNSDFAKLTK